MPSSWLFKVIGPVAMLVAFAAGFLLMRRRLPLSPRQARRQNKWAPLFTAALMVVLAYVQWREGNAWNASLLLIVALVMLGSMLVQWLRTPPAHEAVQNFAVDRGHCGQCEYDLTGNTSGVCPECGWRIPAGELDVDSPGWAIWWRKWEIERLRNWRRTLTSLVWTVVFFVAAGAMMGVEFGIIAVVPMLLMAASFGVNIVRVMAYGRRTRGSESVKASAMQERSSLQK